MHLLSTPIGWLELGLLLFIIEVVVPGIFFMWWGCAAVLIGIMVYVFPFSFSTQIVLFSLMAISFSLFWWRYQREKTHKEDQHSSLNHRANLMIGNVGVVESILDNGTIRGKFGDTTWRILGEELRIGDKIKVVAVDGIILYVNRITD